MGFKIAADDRDLYKAWLLYNTSSVLETSTPQHLGCYVCSLATTNSNSELSMHLLLGYHKLALDMYRCTGCCYE